MKYLYALSFVLFSLIGSAQTGIQFDKASHNFGKIPKGINKTVVFNFTNLNAKPAVIEFANAECGCTQPVYDMNPIVKGKTGTVKVTYTAPTMGSFRKKVTIKFAGIKEPTELVIEGEVVANK